MENHSQISDETCTMSNDFFSFRRQDREIVMGGLQFVVREACVFGSVRLFSGPFFVVRNKHGDNVNCSRDVSFVVQLQLSRKDFNDIFYHYDPVSQLLVRRVFFWNRAVFDGGSGGLTPRKR